MSYLAPSVSFSLISFVASIIFGSTFSSSLHLSRTSYMVSLNIGSCSFSKEMIVFLKIDMHFLYSRLILLSAGTWPSLVFWVGEYIQT